MFYYEQPPEDWSPENKAYIHRLMVSIDYAANGINGVAIRDQVPDRPKEGKIYYLREDLGNGATEGYYVYINYVWKKLAYE